ncbi:MAG TPA: glycoside hydrolase family 99-like domain-containing protein [Stellaceae bacterium]|nr:glycoside hydrolase family 99-like domain-containing protein [Stellaceae bacterium]
MNLLQQIEFNHTPGPRFEPDDADIALPTQLPVRLLAYYLPQFHPIPENDQWWGKGFTEWTNVTKALPRFVGHYQPQLPTALGFYDLRLPQTLREQALLAKRHGIFGFCFYYYWFGGRRLLDAPLNLLLSYPDIEMPFCIIWANENWTRTWDGAEKKILIGQKHSAEDDLAFAAAIEPALRDPRYIRINGRPLLMVYRAGILPDPHATVARWREYFIANGVGDPYLVMAQTFGDNDPHVYGMDAAASFPPHDFGLDSPITKTLQFVDPGFRGQVFSYEAMAERFYTKNRYETFPAVCTGWDNEPRRPGRGRTYAGSTPQLYGRWLHRACRKALQTSNPDERIVFINAWNEWTEGAHLEPDRHYGYAYLRETARVLHGLGRSLEGDPQSDDDVILRVPVRRRLRAYLVALLRQSKRKRKLVSDRLRAAFR